MWTYPELAVALAAHAGETNAAAAEALAAETIPGTRDIPCAEIETLLLETGEWGGLQYLAERAQPGDGITADLIAAAMTTIRAIDRKGVIETTAPGPWALYQQMIGAFRAAGIIADTTEDALLALRDTSTPLWRPAPTDADVAHARTLMGV